ncbi:MAG: sulfur carrier protein ThiS [Actinomycetota bacterium]
MATQEQDGSIAIEANGRPLHLAAGATVRDVVAALGADPDERGVAVAVDGAVVPRSAWKETPLRADQRVEVVRATAGG